MMRFQPFVVALIGLVLSAYIGYHFIHLPQQKEVASLKGQFTEEQLKQKTQQEVDALLTHVDQYRRVLSPEPDTSRLVQEVIQLGQRAGLQLTTINPETPQPFKPLTRLAASFQFTASYHQLGTLLDALERSSQFIRVERVNVGQVQSDGKASVQLVVSTFYAPPVAKGS